jgi:large-conductance mechanosensitive channel
VKRIGYILAGIGGVFILLAFVLLAFVISGFEREKNVDKTERARQARWKKKKDPGQEEEEELLQEEEQEQKPAAAAQPVHQNGTS